VQLALRQVLPTAQPRYLGHSWWRARNRGRLGIAATTAYEWQREGHAVLRRIGHIVPTGRSLDPEIY
jgi:hypothetical protein